MPPKKKQVFSLDQLNNQGVAANNGNNNRKNNKGFYTGDNHTTTHSSGPQNNNYKNQHGNNNNNNNNNHSQHSNQPHDRSRQGYNDRFSNNDTNTAQHIPYWPISLTNAYTMPFSIPLPVHLTKADISREFSTNSHAKSSKAQDKAREKGINPNYKGGGNQQEAIVASDNDHEYVIDTKMRHIYRYGLQSLLKTEFASLVGNKDDGVSLMNSPVADNDRNKNKKNNNAQSSSLDSTHKIQLPAYSEMLPETPYNQLSFLYDKVYDNEDPELKDYIDSGFYSPMGKKVSKNANKMVDQAENQLDVYNSPFNIKDDKKCNVIDSDSDEDFFPVEGGTQSDSNLFDQKQYKNIDFNIIKLFQEKKFSSQFGSEYPCLVEGELVIVQRDRNNYLRLNNCDYDFMIQSPNLNRAFHGDHVIANVHYPSQWRVQRVVPLPPDESAKSTEKNDKTDKTDQARTDGDKKKENVPKGTKVGDWGAVRQVPKINQFLESNMVKKLTEIEYYRQIDYWYKACRYGVYSTPVTIDDIENLRQQDQTMESMNLFSPTAAATSPADSFRVKNGSDNVDDDDEFNTTTFLDKTSTLFGYSHDDVTTININGIETHISNMVNSNVDQNGEGNNSHYPKFTNKLAQTIEQYLYTRKMWQKYKPSRINAQYSQHPQLVTKLQHTSSKKAIQKGNGGGVVQTTTETDPSFISFADLDHSDLNAVREALFTWYSSLRYQTPSEQALLSDSGFLSPMTPPSLTGPLPILSWNPSLWYVNFIMALLHTFFPAFQFQPSCSVVSVRNLFGPALKFSLPPISKVFGFWLHDNSTPALLSGGNKMDEMMTQNVTNASKAPQKDAQGYLYDHYINKCQHYGLDQDNYHHISELPPTKDEFKHVNQNEKKNNKNHKNNTNEPNNDSNKKHKERGITWYRGYNATLAQTAYNHLEDIIVTNASGNNGIKIDASGKITQNDKTIVNKPAPEEEIGKTNNNKKSLYPCLPDHIKSVLFGRERYFCSTFVSMRITSVYQDIWNTAINFPLTLLTTHDNNANFKQIIQQYKKSVQDVLETMDIASDFNKTNPALVTVGYQPHIDESQDKSGDKDGKGEEKKKKTIKVQIQPQNLRFPPVEITLTYLIVADIDDDLAKDYCEENGIIYDANSLKNARIFDAGQQTQFETIDDKDSSNSTALHVPNSEKKSSSNDTGLQADELRDVLGSEYTFPCQIMLEIAGVNMALLRQHAPKLYCWFLCTLSRMHSIAIFVNKKAKILEPLIQLKLNELEFNTRFSDKKTKSQRNDEQTQNISPFDAQTNALLTKEVEKFNQKTLGVLSIQPRSIQLISSASPQTSRNSSTTRNFTEISNSYGGVGSDSYGQVSNEFGFRRKNLMKNDQQDDNLHAHNFPDPSRKASSLEPTPEQLIHQRETQLALLDSIVVGPVYQPLNGDENEQLDQQIRVVNPTYALSIIEQQALSQFLPGIFIIQYTNWPFAVNTPTISFHSELGGNALITSSDKLLPVLIKHKITQSDVFSPLIEAELQAQLAVLSSGNDEPMNGIVQVKDEWPIPEAEAKSRVDLRKMLIFSIDPLTAKDLDDTLSMEYIGLSSQWPRGYFSNVPTGTAPRAIFRVGVHIADVSFFVRANTLLDQEACSRSTSIYLSTFVIPMLPRILCEELCSLNQGKDRLAFSCFFLMDDEGTVLEIDRHIRAKNTIRFDDNIIDIVTRTKDGKDLTEKGTHQKDDKTPHHHHQQQQQQHSDLISIQEKLNYEKRIYTLTDLLDPTLPVHKTDQSKPSTFGSLEELEAQLKADALNEYDSLDNYGRNPDNFVKNIRKAPKFDQNGNKIRYHNDLSDDNDDDDDDEGKQVGYISGSDDEYENTDFLLTDKGQANLNKALGDLSIDPLSSVSTRKRGKAPERRGKARNPEAGDDNDDDQITFKDTGLAGSNKAHDKDTKDSVTPHEAWSRFVTETSWYGKSIIRSALKLDYRTAMLLVECAFLDPEYQKTVENRNSFIQNFAQKYQNENYIGASLEPPTNFDVLASQYLPQKDEILLLQTRPSSIPLECAQLEAFSPLDISLQLGLHSDEAIMRQIASHEELSELFLTETGRCRPAGYCSKFYNEKVYKLTPEEAMSTGRGQENIPDIARACRLLHSLGMKRRQERLTTLGSLTLTRNKLSFKFGYELDHWLHQNPDVLLQFFKNEHKFDPKLSKFESILLPTEVNRSVQHYTMYPLYDTNRMIEEYMLLGNEFVAKRIYRILPKHALLRKHPNPDENKLTLTTQFLNKLGVPLQTTSAGILQKSLVSLQQQYDRTIERILNGEFDLSTTPTISLDNSTNQSLPNNEEHIEQINNFQNNTLQKPKLGKFEEVCWRLYQAGCDVRSIAEELFAQTMIAAQYFPTGVQRLDKEKLTEISKQFNIQAPKMSQKGPKNGNNGNNANNNPKKSQNLKQASKNVSSKKPSGGAAAAASSTPSTKTQRQFKWALEREWVTNFKHYALNMDFYTHYTSPIRRYPDIIVHRVLECSLFIEPASNQLPSSPFYKQRADTTIDDIFFNHKIDSTGLAQNHTDLLLGYKTHDGTAKAVSKKDVEQTTTTPDANPSEPVPEWTRSDESLLATDYPTRFEQDMSVFDLVRILPRPLFDDSQHLKIKGVSQSLSNAQSYIKTTTPQLVLQQCEQFNSQKSEAKYAGDDSSNLTFCELILRRQYQLNWLLQHTVNNEYQNPQDMLQYYM